MIGQRIGSVLGVLAFVALLRLGCPSMEAQTRWLHLIALPIGYGHLFGGLWFARRRIAQRLPPDLPAGLVVAFALVFLANSLAAYSWALHEPELAAWVLVPMLLVSAWHIVEDDLALAEAYRSRLELGSGRRSRRDRLVACSATGLVGLAALLTPTGAYYGSVWFGARIPPLAPFTVDELAAAVLLYHAVSWLVFFSDRGRRLARRDRVAARRLRYRLLALHAVPLAVNALLLCCAPAVHLYLASPTLYLFWSVAHAAQTAWVRSSRSPITAQAAA